MDQLIERLELLHSEGKRKLRSDEDLMEMLLKLRVVVKVGKGTEIKRQEGVNDDLKLHGDKLLEGKVALLPRDVGDWWEMDHQGGNEDPIFEAMKWNYKHAKTADEPTWLELTAEFVRDAYLVIPHEERMFIYDDENVEYGEKIEIENFLKTFKSDGEYHSQGIELRESDGLIKIISYEAYTKGGLRGLLM